MSEQAKHTPGPWSIVEYGDEKSPALAIHTDSETRICFMATPGSHGDPAKIESNANLIAAAPDLHAAADKALYAIDNILGAHEGQAEHNSLYRACAALEAALNKAEGRS